MIYFTSLWLLLLLLVFFFTNLFIHSLYLCVAASHSKCAFNFRCSNNISHIFFYVLYDHARALVWIFTDTQIHSLEYDSIITFMLINCFFMQLTHSLICCYYCYYHLVCFFFPHTSSFFFNVLFDVMIMMMLMVSRAQFKQSTADGRYFKIKKKILQNKTEPKLAEQNRTEQAIPTVHLTRAPFLFSTSFF